MLSRTVTIFRRFDYIFLIFLFVLSRLLVRISGIEFESIAHRWCYQHLPPNLLEISLVKSLWYLHMQPPFFNFLLGIGYKLPGDGALFFNLLFLLFSLGSILCFYASLKKIGLPLPICFLAALLLMASPSLIQFENILFYSVFIFFLLFVMLFALCSFSRTRNAIRWFKYLCLFSFAALLLMLTRSLFHLVWFLTLTIGFYVLAHRESFDHLKRKYFFFALTPPICVILLLLLKNYFLFGVFQTSSWFGMNLSRAALEGISYEKLEELHHSGRISHFPLIVKKYKFPFHFLDKYGMKLGDIGGTTQHPSLFWYLNSIEYIHISKNLAKDSLAIIMTDPTVYLKTVYRSSKVFFDPTTEHARSFPDQYRYNLLWKPLYYPFHSNLLQILVYFYVVLVSGVYTICGLVGEKFRVLPDKYTAFYTFVTLVYFFFAATMFEFGENNRFRFEVLPLVLFGLPWSYRAFQDFVSVLSYKKLGI